MARQVSDVDFVTRALQVRRDRDAMMAQAFIGLARLVFRPFQSAIPARAATHSRLA
jgi:hypothetical protein